MSEEKKPLTAAEARELANTIAEMVEACGAQGYRDLVELLSYANRIRS